MFRLALVALFAPGQGAPSNCPAVWTPEWAKGMAQIMERFIFKEIVTDPNAWGISSRLNSCYPKVTDVVCTPPLDDIEGEYPFEHQCRIEYDGLGNSGCEANVLTKQYNTYYAIERSALAKGDERRCNGFGAIRL